MKSVNKLQFWIGFLALLLGLLLYLVARPSDTYFVSLIKEFEHTTYWKPSILKPFLGALPSFLHVFAFSLLMGGLVACRKGGYLFICISWLAINAMFELGQRHFVVASQLVPQWFEGVLLLENLKDYFLKGTFDYYDLVAATIGAAAAYWTLAITMDEKWR